jgi:Ca2+/H+ antiporter
MANTSGHSKKVAVNGIMFLAYCVGNILAPQFFRASEAPQYTTAYRAILSGITIGNFCLIIYAVGIWYENRKTKKAFGDVSNDGLSTEDKLLDVTDKEKEGFVYVY